MLKHQKIIDRMRLEDKVALCSGADSWSTKAFEEYGIPSVKMTDGPHGLRKANGDGTPGAGKSVPATCFPTASATACSWDRALLHEMGAAIAEEALQEGVSIILGPGTNLKRNPLCGRNFEYFSEDPYLAGEMATAWINGVQSQGVGVSLKHFAANNQENQRMTSNSIVDERTLRELYLPAFEKAVKAARPATLMCAYNQLNGTFCSDHVYLLRKVLRDEWGFEGVIMTDWGAMNDRVAAFQAGLDLEMPGSAGFFDHAVIHAVKSGALAEARVDESVNRLLELVFNGDKQRAPGYRYDVDAHHALAKKVAAGSAVLLKNEGGILPMQETQRIALIGALAKEPRYQGAGSSFINPTRLDSAYDGFGELGLQFTYFPGYLLKGPASKELLEEAAAGARESDVAVVFAGLTEEIESEGYDRSDMRLPPAHNDLIERVAQANPNTVVVLVGGAPVEMPWLPRVKAVLHMSLAGQAGGLAAAELLAGISNPSGKLAESYPLRYEDVPSAGFYEEGGRQAQYREGIYVGYRYYDKAAKAVCFPFGFGLSYTTFEYQDLRLSCGELQAGQPLEASVTVRNSGSLAGAEIVQLYVSDPEHIAFRPEKELREFEKVFLQPGEEKTIQFHLDSRAFACFDPGASAWVVPPGTYVVRVGASSRDIRLQAAVTVRGMELQPGALQQPGWYVTLEGKPSQADFEQILGRRIAPLKAPKKGEFTLSSTLRDMQGSFFVRMMLRSIEKQVAASYGGVDYSNPNFRMAVESASSMPMSKLAVMSNGAMKANVAEALVHLANGQIWKGIKAFLQR